MAEIYDQVASMAGNKLASLLRATNSEKKAAKLIEPHEREAKEARSKGEEASSKK